MATTWHSFPDAEAMADAAAAHVETAIAAAIAHRGSACVALTGGRTPIPIFQRLARRRSFNWARVVLIPTDDRLVDPATDLSNVNLIRSWFGDTGATIVALTQAGRLTRDAAAQDAERVLRDLGWPIDLLWLGMGADGHTGSILPGPDFVQALAADTERLAVAVTPEPLPPEAPVARVTLTRAAMLRTRAAMLTITGSAKRDVLADAIVQGERAETAIGRVLAGMSVPVDLFWSA